MLKLKFLSILALCCLSNVLFSQEEKLDEAIILFDKPFDFNGVFCKYLFSAQNYSGEISREHIDNSATNTVSEWLKYEEKNKSATNIEYYYLRLVYVAFKKCEVFRDHYHYLFDQDNIGRDGIEMQHIAFSNALHFLQRRGFRVLPPEYKLFDNMETYKKNLKRFDWVMMKSAKYLGNKKYRIEYYLFNPNGYTKARDIKNLLMEIEIGIDEDNLTDFEYKEYQANLEMAGTYMNQFFGTPPPSPNSPTKN